MQRDARHEAIVQMLLDRDVDDRAAREKRQFGYAQSVDSGAGPAGSETCSDSPIRLHHMRTKVPCRITAQASALLRQLSTQFSGHRISFVEVTRHQQAVMLTLDSGKLHRIGWFEECVDTNSLHCNVRNHGLSVDTDGDRMLIIRFRYPQTPVRVTSPHNVDAEINPFVSNPTDETAWLDFTEIRPALALQPVDGESSPSLVWVTRSEFETIDSLGSRDYEAFYVRFKLEVQTGVWKALSGLLARSAVSQSHRGSYYTVVHQPDVAKGRVYQSTVDDNGNAVDVGRNRTYDASAATDILLLYLAGDILADIADIYFTLQSLNSAAVASGKAELFSVIQNFWANTDSLTWRYDTEEPPVLCMSQRAVPTPAQAALLKQDWTNLRQALVDRFGEAGRYASEIAARNIHCTYSLPATWPFAVFAPGEVNVGLRLVHRHEWKQLGSKPTDTIDPSDYAPSLKEVLDEAAKASITAMKWPLEIDGSINIGVRTLAARTDMGLESECCASSRDLSTHLGNIIRRMVSKVRDETSLVATAERSKAQNRYEVVTRPAELQNIVMVAEKLPAPAEIDESWVKRHDWILAKVLIDESLRDALNCFRQEPQLPHSATISDEVESTPDESSQDIDASFATPAHSDTTNMAANAELNAMRQRFVEHVRANILHYQRAIWQQEDPHQRSMRYRKSGKQVPLEWRFELAAHDAMSIDDLCERLTATNVDARFAAYSSARAAYLDEVIDPAGPIGYFGNFAIYHMRPEFGDGDLFSMLHFFKSPYLRPNAETGEAQVTDPVEIYTDEQRATFSANHALVRTTGSAGEKSAAAAVLQPAPQGYELIMESDNAIDVHGAIGRRDVQVDWMIHSRDEELVPHLVAAAGVGHAPHPMEEPVIVPPCAEAPMHTLLAGAAPAHEQPIRATRDAETTSGLRAGAGAHRADERTIITPDDAQLTPRLQVGDRAAPPRDPDAETLILTRDDERLRPNLVAG